MTVSPYPSSVRRTLRHRSHATTTDALTVTHRRHITGINMPLERRVPDLVLHVIKKGPSR